MPTDHLHTPFPLQHTDRQRAAPRTLRRAHIYPARSSANTREPAVPLIQDRYTAEKSRRNRKVPDFVALGQTSRCRGLSVFLLPNKVRITPMFFHITASLFFPEQY